MTLSSSSITVVDRLDLVFASAELDSGQRPGLFARPRGPNRKRLRNAYFRQGSLDGACGPYAVSMALAMHDTDVNSEEFAKRLSECLRGSGVGPLADKGTDYNALAAVVSVLKPGWELRPIREAGTAAGLRAIADKIANAGKPILVGIKGIDFGHWTVGVGFEGKPEAPRRIFLLDPAGSKPLVCHWNGVLERKNSSGPVTYRYARVDEGIQVSDRAVVDEAHFLAMKPPPEVPSKKKKTRQTAQATRQDSR